MNDLQNGYRYCFMYKGTAFIGEYRKKDNSLVIDSAVEINDGNSLKVESCKSIEKLGGIN